MGGNRPNQLYAYLLSGNDELNIQLCARNYWYIILFKGNTAELLSLHVHAHIHFISTENSHTNLLVKPLRRKQSYVIIVDMIRCPTYPIWALETPKLFLGQTQQRAYTLNDNVSRGGGSNTLVHKNSMFLRLEATFNR